LTYGGFLVLSNLGPTALAAGDNFKLFDATNFAGSFSTITFPPLGPGLGWTNKLALDGSLQVVVAPNREFGVDVSQAQNPSGIQQPLWNQMFAEGILFDFTTATE